MMGARWLKRQLRKAAAFHAKHQIFHLLTPLARNTRAFAFNLKELGIFFVIFLVGSLGGNLANSYLGIEPGTGLLAYGLFSLVPMFFIYVLWKYVTGKKQTN